MKQLFSHNKQVVKTVFFTSLFWILVILALKLTNQSSQITVPVLSASPKTELKYSDEVDPYFSLQPLPLKNENPTVIKRN